MAKIINSPRFTGTIVGGSENINFSFPLGVICKQIIVKTDNANTTFDFKIVDKDGDTIYERDDEKGVINELIELPLMGSYTAQIRNANNDGDVTLKFSVWEI